MTLQNETTTDPALGCMFFGTRVSERDAFTLLDQFVAGGGTLLDTANNYAFWVDGGTGDESELLLGRWLTTGDARDHVQLATKIGARPRPGARSTSDAEGLSPTAIRDQLQGSLRRLGVDRVDLLYAHIDDRATPLAETLATFDALVTEGVVGAVASSNYTLARQQEADALVDAHRWAPLGAVQLRATYLTPAPGADFGVQVSLDDDLLAYVVGRGKRVFGYSSLLAGAYARPDQPVPEDYRHAPTAHQLAALRSTAERLGVTVNQVVLAWLRARGVSPVLGVSRPAQLTEVLAEVELDERARTDLDAARGLR